METGAFRKCSVDTLYVLWSLRTRTRKKNVGVCLAFPGRDCVTEKQRRNGTSFLISHYQLPADNAAPFISPFSLHHHLTPRGKRQPPFPMAALAPCWPALQRLQLRHPIPPRPGKQVSVSPLSVLASDLPAKPLPTSFPKLAQNAHFRKPEATLEKPSG